jgi:transposase InsO family protein
MAQKVTAMDVRMAAALAPGVLPDVKAYCEEQGISRQTFYKYRARFLEEGIEGLQQRSRRPHLSPQALSPAMTELLVLTRKELLRDGCDAGAAAILDVLTGQDRRPEWNLTAQERWPAAATVHRLLVREGLVQPAPAKRPRSSLCRFSYPRPNDCWQSDWTHWQLADGTPVAIAGTLDDHSRLMAGLRCGLGDGDNVLVWETMLDAVSRYGIPAMSLTDNGLCYSMARRGSGEAAFEANLRMLGTVTITSTPYHPQTCGKIERFWQTLKKWLRARPAAATLEELQELLDEFRSYYNERRRHSAIGRRTPLSVWQAGTKARPALSPLPGPLDVLQLTAADSGNIGVGPWTVGLGRRFARCPVTVIRDDLTVTVFSHTEHLATWTITQPDKHYQSAPVPRNPNGRPPRKAQSTL